jgi:heme exporter protein D
MTERTIFQEIETEPPRNRRHDFAICCILGASTCALLIYRAVRMHRLVAPWGWVHLGIALLAMAVAAFHFVVQERNLSSNRDRIDQKTLRRLRNSNEWLYVAFNAGVFGVMYFVTHFVR